MINGRDPISLLHLKRIKKNKDGTLKIILCSIEYDMEPKEICDALLKISNDSFKYCNLVDCSVPRCSPTSKELMAEWSNKYWPLVWNGNPNDQILNDYEIDMKTVRETLDKITEVAKKVQESGDELPIVTAFVDPLDKENIIIATDKRSSPHCTILDHSIINGIKEVARQEKQRRDLVAKGELEDRISTYLCLDFDVYTTHEPCSMCSMALIHSRIRRCIFLQQMEKTGCLKQDSGDGYCMHANEFLNSKYEVFQWIGDEYPVPKIASDLCT